MTREQFLMELRKKLKRLPKDEIENVMTYYKEYFEDCDKTDEEAVKELGSPSAISSQILANYAFDDKKESSGIGYKILLIVLAIFAAPVALPLAIAGVAVLFAIALSIGAVLLALIITVIAFFAAGIGACIAGAAVIFQGPATSMFYIGAGLIILGISIICVYGIKELVPKAYLYMQDISCAVIAKLNKNRNKGE